jgi:hypothetical protein
MAAPSSFVRIRLNPIADARLPFPAQLVLGLVMVAYALAALLTSAEPDGGAASRPLLHAVFLGFAVTYLGYIIARSSPLFGTQSYLEMTPDYLVHKRGLFQPKMAFQAEELSRIELSDHELRIIPRNGEVHAVSLKQVRGPKKRGRLRAGLEAFTQRHGVELRTAA